jgi:hypothetical protein
VDAQIGQLIRTANGGDAAAASYTPSPSASCIAAVPSSPSAPPASPSCRPRERRPRVSRGVCFWSVRIRGWFPIYHYEAGPFPRSATGRCPIERPHQQVRIHLTPEQQEQFKRATGKDGEEIELTVELLEERIAPKPASNHNATLLVDR